MWCNVAWASALGITAATGLDAQAVPVPVAPPRPPTLPIIGGEAVEPGQYPAVVSLEMGVLRTFPCTGVLVAPTLVLTAAHCLVGRPPDEPITVHTGATRGDGPEATAVSFAAHPDYVADATAHDLFDYGYIVIDRELPGPYGVPVTDQETWDFALQWDREVTIVGYGRVADDAPDDGIKRAVTVPIDGFSPAGLEFAAGGDGEDSCPGDSGGPVFVTLKDGTRRLVGIVSRGSRVCGGGGIYGVPHPSLCWVREESGVDVTGACSTCDCIDTTPPPRPKDGCGRCAASGSDAGAGWLFVLLLAGLPRTLSRRRRRLRARLAGASRCARASPRPR